MVTWCSCIASSSADCVLGGVRLISSASTMLLKIGPGMKTSSRLPVSRVFLDEVGTGDVRRHQIGRELDARELEVEHLGDGVHDQGLRETGDAGDDAIAPHEERQEHLLDRLFLADDELAELRGDVLIGGLEAIRQGNVVGSLQGYVCFFVSQSSSSFLTATRPATPGGRSTAVSA